MNESPTTSAGHLLPSSQQITSNKDRDSELEGANRYAMALDLAVGKDILVIGCGDGSGALTLAKRARSVLVFDRSGPMISQANQRYQANNLRFETKLSVADSSMDLIVCFEMSRDTPESESFLDETKRILRPDGLILLTRPLKTRPAPRHPLSETANNLQPADIQKTSGETALLNHVKTLEKRISRMECSFWWRLRRPVKLYWIWCIIVHLRDYSHQVRPRANLKKKTAVN